jgi:flavin-dependent dehydrogenase
MIVSSTLSLQNAIEDPWDAIIIGAGVAGAATAILAAQSGLRVLLVEAKQFPREKVCGGCLNQRAQASLERLGLAAAVRSIGGVPLRELHVQVLQSGYTWGIPELISIRRSTLDTLMVQRAIDGQVQFLSNTTATLCLTEDSNKNADLHQRRWIEVQLRPTNSKDFEMARAASVVVSAGLSRSALRPSHPWPSSIDKHSRIGVQSMIDLQELVEQVPGLGESLKRHPNRLSMLASSSGYAGICLTDGEQVDIAAAIDPGALNASQGIPGVIKSILSDSGIASGNFLGTCQWLATPLLTRQSTRVAMPGVFLVGDSLGYVEPFTGEGMSWALDNAEKVTPLLLRISNKFEQRVQVQQEWESYVAAHRQFRQRMCRWVAKQARHPVRSQWVLKAFDWLPPFRKRILKEAVQ